MADIHQTAIIQDGAEIEEDVVIGPYCIVSSQARVRKGSRLYNNVSLDGKVDIGESCTIFPFASIGLPPQDLKYNNEPTEVVIGDRNIIREYTTIHRASVGGNGTTRIGSDNFIMAYAHIAHDCLIGNKIIMANVANLAGHVLVEDNAVLGGLIAVHQFVRIGAYAMIGGFSGVAQDVPPYMIAAGSRVKLHGLNVVGLKRNGFSSEAITDLRKAYKILFRNNKTLKDAVKRVQEELPYTEEIASLLEFINLNRRGICRAANKSSEEV